MRASRRRPIHDSDRFRCPTTPCPRLASTTLVVRDGPEGVEVLMLRRSLQASFMPGAYVFPGGAVDAADTRPALLAACDETRDALAARWGAGRYGDRPCGGGAARVLRGMWPVAR